MGLVAPARDYTVLLPGLIAFGVGLAMATSPITTAAISEVPRDRLGIASSLPNISRYVGGALGSAILVALVGSTTSDGSDRRNDLIAADFRIALFAAAGMLAVAALIAIRMPPVRGVAPGRVHEPDAARERP
jgi:MFS family permease